MAADDAAGVANGVAGEAPGAGLTGGGAARTRRPWSAVVRGGAGGGGSEGLGPPGRPGRGMDS